MTRPRHALVLASFVLACAIACAAPAQASTGTIGLQLLDVPAAARFDPRARLYIVDHLAPGTVIRRRIKVSNTTDAAAGVATYPAAAGIAKGSFLGAAGHARNELSTWTSIQPRTTKIPAGAGATAVVTIAVPRDAAPGERYGVVWAEVRSPPSKRDGITQVSRVGIRLYVSVGPGGAPAANFKIGSLTAGRSPDGRPMIRAMVRNTGGRALDMNGTLRLSAGPGGLSAGPFPANLGVTLGVGDTAPVVIALDKQLPAGPWLARVSLHSGLLDRTARATITFPGEEKANSKLPLLAAALGALLVLAAMTGVQLRRRRLVRH